MGKAGLLHHKTILRLGQAHSFHEVHGIALSLVAALSSFNIKLNCLIASTDETVQTLIILYPKQLAQNPREIPCVGVNESFLNKRMEL